MRQVKTGEATGIAISELTHPYYSYLNAGMKIDVASIMGGRIPVDPDGLRRTVITAEDKRYLNDPALIAKMENSLRIDDVDFNNTTSFFSSVVGRRLRSRIFRRVGR